MAADEASSTGEPRLANLTLDVFVQQLASNEPVPGGGAVAALTGTLAAALGQMAAGFTTGKPQFAETAPRVAEIDSRLKRAGELLLELMQEDASAYQQLSAVLKTPRTEPGRPARLQAAASMAAAVPLQTAALARKVRLDLARLLPLANPNLRSDIECGLHLAAAAMHAAAINVRVNLRLLPADEAQRVESELTALLADPHASEAAPG